MSNWRQLISKGLSPENAAAATLAQRIGVDPAQTESYRTGFARLLQLTHLLTLTIFVLSGVLLFTLLNYVPENGYIAETSEGVRTPLVGLETPYITQQTLFDWASESASQIMTFGFNDYDKKLSAVRDKFTLKGWTSFAQEMNQSSLFKSVLAEQQIITAVPRDTPVMIFEGLDMGVFNWVVEMPMMVTVRSGSVSRSLNQTVRLVIVRVPTAENPMGIAIDRWISY